MSGRTLLILSVIIAAALLVPLSASGALKNEYGMTFAGQDKCLECHDGTYGLTVHGRFAKTGLMPAAPAGWTTFRAAGDLPAVGAMTPFSGAPWFTSGGEYPIALNWITLGDWEGGAATEYILFNGNTSGSNKNPWNLVEGLIAEPGVGWEVGSEAPTKGLYDVVYGCQRCHMLGTTTNTANSTATAAVPNPVVTVAATYTTALQWARSDATTVGDFNTNPAVSTPGMSIQCEACHGTGFKSSTFTTKHWNSGTQLSHRVPTGTVVASGGVLPGTTYSTLGQSQVCGQCHGSYTTVAGTLGIYGFTPNLPLRNFVNINGGTPSYTYTPTEAEFLAAPTSYYLFPNGSNAKGNHYYYNEWATSAHAYRGAWLSTASGHNEDPDALPGGTAGHYNSKGSGLDCARCHTGEGYLISKQIGMWADLTPTTGTPTSATQVQVGYMGQECIVCHDAHPAGVGVETNIREADAAGVRSNAANAAITAAGLPANTTANASMCEDCHNWQLEVQGTAPTIKPQASLASRGGPSHPQRETLHGRVMLEVPAAGEFMPGAECQECHMPKTSRNANRYSHGMHIMLPGKAEEWNTAAGATYKGEDSCSPCHPGETRAELQANIDSWQDAAADAAADASAAIVAAIARANTEFSMTDSTKPGYILVGRATWNYKAFGSDGSGGAHNPLYAVKGLKAAKTMADSVGGSFNQLYSSSKITVGGLGSIVGHVRNGNGSNAVGARVALEHYNGTTWVQEGSATTDANGNVAFMLSPTIGNHSFRLRWDRCSVNSTDRYSAVRVIPVVGAQVPGKVTIVKSASTILLYRYVILSGSVIPATSAGGVITIQAKWGTGSWITWNRLVLPPNSTYSKAIKPSRRGTWYFRTVYGGNAEVGPCISSIVSVTVR